MPGSVGDRGSRRGRGTSPGGQSQPGHATDPPTGSRYSRPRETFDVRFWKIRVYKGKRGRSYSVRWTVAGREFHQAYETSALAESRLAELRTFARDGVAFDTETGLPVPEVRGVRAQAAQADGVSWYEHAVRYVARRWEALSPNSRRSVAETLTNVMPVMLAPGKDRPSDTELRQALYKWAFRNEPKPPEEVAQVLAWIAEHSLPVSALTN